MLKKPGLVEAVEAWEGEGGAVPVPGKPLAGAANQAPWAGQLQSNVNAEFDRVAKALESDDLTDGFRDTPR